MNTYSRNFSTAREQRGVVLFIALIMLVAMSIAGIGLMRSVGGGVMLAGNLSLKQTTTRMADRGFEFARDWMMDTFTADDTALDNSNPGQGYFANGLDLAQIDFKPTQKDNAWWTGNSKIVAGTGMLDDFTIQYVIHRMCESEGALTAEGQQCVRHATPEPACSNPLGCGPAVIKALYRATIRVTGPKKTESFVQVMFY